MTKRSHRLLKKIHKRWLVDIVDLSQYPHWRTRLFDSASGQVFAISVDDTRGLRGEAVAAVCRYKLHFSLQKVESSDADAWLSEGGGVIFKFWASTYPSVRIHSGNNPLVARVT
jgi:hypothetical protein